MTPRLLVLDSAAIDTLLTLENSLEDIPWREQHFIDSFAAGHATSGVYMGEALAGFSITSMAAEEVTVLKIATAKTWQRQGLATLLLDAALAAARKRGASSCFLEVRESNVGAQEFYYHYGFYESGRRENYYPTLKGREAAVLMHLPMEGW